MVAALLALALALPSAPTPKEPQWRVHITASGTYNVDYGADGDLVDGQASGGWQWEMKAAASGYGVDTDTAIFRMNVGGASTIVVPGGEPYCRPPESNAVGWVRDARVGLYFDARRRGFQVDQPFGDLLTGCHVGAHGMTLYEGAAPASTRILRRDFRPRSDRSFDRTWSQVINLDRSHDPGQDAHTFQVSGNITIEIRRISPRTARALRLRLRSTPRTPPA
jgi:hypothetical protein